MLLKLRALALLLISPRGRIGRLPYWLAAATVTAIFLLTLPMLKPLLGRWGTVAAYLPFYWAAYCLMAKRCHDIGRSAAWLFVLLIPVAGPLWLFAVLGFRRGNPGVNQYGSDPRRMQPDYLVVKAVA